jgi:hypothetical protein
MAVAMINTDIANDNLVQALRGALGEGQEGLKRVPDLLRAVLKEDAWQERYDQLGRRPARFESFAAFVTRPPTEGLGGDLAMVRRLIDDDPELVDLYTKALQRPPGRPNKTLENHERYRAPTNGKEADLRRLRKDRPDLHAQVLNGELSAHAAAVEAGFRRRTFSAPVDDPERIAAALRRHLSPEDLYEVLILLGEP